jgi:hypothetical protein
MARGASFLALVLLAAAAARAQQCVCNNDQQTPLVDQNGCIIGGGADVSPAPATEPQNRGPQRVLYYTIPRSVSSWYNNLMLRNVSGLLRATVAQANPSSTVDVYYSTSAGLFTFSPAGVAQAATPPSEADMHGYNQVWFFDLDESVSAPPSMVPMLDRIAYWFTVVKRNDTDVIVDARFTSDLWNTRAFDALHGTSIVFAGSNPWTLNSLDGISPVIDSSSPFAPFKQTLDGFTPNNRPNQNIFINYFNQLRARGKGGIVILTDHDDYWRTGPAQLSQRIGLNPFIPGQYFQDPFAMEVDTGNPLFTWPTIASHHPRTLPGRTCVSRFLYDDSSTGFLPSGLQPNGLTLFPAGWHGVDLSLPGIVTTIRGTRGFVVDIVQPTCPLVLVAGVPQTFNAQGRLIDSFPDSAPIAYSWKIDGVPQPQCNSLSCVITYAATGGSHVLELVATDARDRVARDFVCLTVPSEPTDLVTVGCNCAAAVASSDGESVTLAFAQGALCQP